MFGCIHDWLLGGLEVPERDDGREWLTVVGAVMAEVGKFLLQLGCGEILAIKARIGCWPRKASLRASSEIPLGGPSDFRRASGAVPSGPKVLPLLSVSSPWAVSL